MSIDPKYIILTNDNFQSQVVEAKIPVLVDCWASWCGSFQGMNPMICELATEFAGQICIGRLNVATSEKVVAHYGIRAVPTLLLFQAGQVVVRVIGGISRQDLTHKLNVLLASRFVSRSQITCL